MPYTWTMPPLKLVEELDPALSPDVQIVQDDMNQASLNLRAFEIAPEDRELFNLGDEGEAFFEQSRALADDGAEQDDLLVHGGFWLDRNADLGAPEPADVFVLLTGDTTGVYLPVGQHAEGRAWPGDYLISREDYLRISAGLYTPATYLLVPELAPYDPRRAIGTWESA